MGEHCPSQCFELYGVNRRFLCVGNSLIISCVAFMTHWIVFPAEQLVHQYSVHIVHQMLSMSMYIEDRTQHTALWHTSSECRT